MRSSKCCKLSKGIPQFVKFSRVSSIYVEIKILGFYYVIAESRSSKTMRLNSNEYKSTTNECHRSNNNNWKCKRRKCIHSKDPINFKLNDYYRI